MKNSKGFTLIEIAIVLVIIGLLLAGAAAALQSYILKKREAELIQKTNAITSALALYIQDESYFGDDPETKTVVEDPEDYVLVRDWRVQFPCPANPELGPGDSDYGKESRSPAYPDSPLVEAWEKPTPTPGGCDASAWGGESGSGSDTVYHGAVPFKELGLSSDQVIDPYKYKFSYSVSKTVSDYGALKDGKKPLGAITVRQYDSGGGYKDIANVPFVIVQHGPTGRGAYYANGAEADDCDNSALDGENCDKNNLFVDAMDYRVTKSGSSKFYDDSIFISLRGIADKEEYWAHSDDTQDVVNMNPGNVGISARSPLARLHVKANTTTGIDDTNKLGSYGDGLAAADAKYYTIIAEGDGDNSGGILITTAEPAGPDENQDGLTLWNSSAGNPSDPGDVVFNVTSQGDVTAQAYLYFSDERLKENIRDLDPDTLKNLMLLRIIKYNLIKGDGDDKIGVIAQQLQEYFPELVHKDKNGMLSVDYVGLVGPIIKAIQEMQTEHKNDVDKLESRIEKLEKDIQSIKGKE